MSFFEPPSKPIPPDYPLQPFDMDGIRIAQGMLVRIVKIPEWLTHDLPLDEVSRLKAVAGRVMPILEMDTHGMLWFGESDPWFCLTPSDVSAVPISSRTGR